MINKYNINIPIFITLLNKKSKRRLTIMRENNKLVLSYLSAIFKKKDDGMKELLNYISTECKENEDQTIKLFIDEDLIDLKPYGSTVVHFCCIHDCIETIKLILSDSNFDPSANDNELIQWASKNGHVDIVKQLLADKRVDPSAGANLAICLASQNGHEKVVKLLLADKRVDPSARNNAAIECASIRELIHQHVIMRQ